MKIGNKLLISKLSFSLTGTINIASFNYFTLTYLFLLPVGRVLHWSVRWYTVFDFLTSTLSLFSLKKEKNKINDPGTLTLF